eukprot:9376823-Alexandrium_andersonii.AAC.1
MSRRLGACARMRAQARAGVRACAWVLVHLSMRLFSRACARVCAQPINLAQASAKGGSGEATQVVAP